MNRIIQSNMTPSINDIIHFLRFLTPCNPFYQIGLWSNVTFWKISPPKSVTSFMDGPLGHVTSMRKCSNSVEFVSIVLIFRLPFKVKSVVQKWVKRLRFRTRLVRCIEFGNIICPLLDGLNIRITTNKIRIGQIFFTTSILLRRKSA